MVFRRSEYGLNFKVSNLIKNIPTYQENLTYRNNRRHLENAHTPLCWGLEEDIPAKQIESDEEIQTKVVADQLQDMSVHADSKPYIKASDKLEPPTKPTNTTAVTESVDTQKQTQAEKEQKAIAKQKLSKYSSKENKNTIQDEKPSVSKKIENISGDLNIVKPKKVEEKTFKRSMSKTISTAAKSVNRPKTAPSTRSSTKAPFMSYGCGARKLEIGENKTYNVRAGAEVHPAAVKAYSKLQEDKKQRRDKELQTALRAKRKRALIKEKLVREAAFWQTEYQSRYPLYNNTEYSNNAERPKRCRSAISAFEI